MRSQPYPDWELCIADDGSSEPRGPARRSSAPPRPTSASSRFCLERNVGISAATNAALALCAGELVAFLDHDDVLAPDALLRVVRGARRAIPRPTSSTGTRTS